MVKEYTINAPRVQIYDRQIHTITKELIENALSNIKVKQKKILSIVCIVISCFVIELGIGSVCLGLFYGVIFIIGGGFGLYLSIKSLNKAKKNINLIKNGNYHIETAICSEILYNTEGLDTLCFKDKKYTTVSIAKDYVGAEYYLLFLDGDFSPVIVFETSGWRLDSDLSAL